MKPLPVLIGDPGTSKLGWARILLHRAPTGGRLAFDRGGHRDLDRGWLYAELQQLREENGIFALETLIGGIFAGRRARPILETRAMEQRILDIAENAGWPMPPRDCLPRAEQVGQHILKIPAGDYTYNKPKKAKQNAPPPKRARKVKPPIWIEGWRGELCGESTASNAQIEIVGAAMVDDAAERIALMPKLQREHVYDAIGLGLVAVHRFLGARVVLPPSVAGPLWMQQRAEDEHRAAENAAKKLGVVIPKPKTRLYSRTERREMGDRVRARAAK